MKRSEPDLLASTTSKLLRYGLATIGPIGVAASQYILSLVLVRALEPEAFGRFSLLLIFSQFVCGIWSALFCAPLPALLAEASRLRQHWMVGSLFSANAVLGILCLVGFWWLAVFIGCTNQTGSLFAAYAVLALFRWFARAHAYATGEPLRSTGSDALYSLILLAGTGVIAFGDLASVASACTALLVGAGVGLVPFGRRYLSDQFLRISRHDLAKYAGVWRGHSGWALIGVVTTEATANLHAYLVAFLVGPTAFAPIAASALVIRPIGVVANALTEFERPQMARQIQRMDLKSILQSIVMFRWVLIASWSGAGMFAGVLASIAPRLIQPAGYDPAALWLGVVLWMAVAGTRLLRTPEGTVLQAAGRFRWLANASIVSAVASAIAVPLLLGLGGPIWSIAGVLVGEVTIAVCIWGYARRWHGEATACSARPVQFTIQSSS